MLIFGPPTAAMYLLSSTVCDYCGRTDVPNPVHEVSPDMADRLNPSGDQGDFLNP